MRRKVLISLVALGMFAGPAAAQQTGVTADPGVIGPNMPVLWGIDKAVDSVLKSPGAVAEERASEALVMSQRGNTNQSRRAVNALNNSLRNANSNDSERLRNVETILSKVQANTPAEADVGLSTALENIRKAKDRRPENPGNNMPEEAGN